ncbi:MAG: DNA polymerase III subunit gamma/tau, partial [Acidobacteria bacterium]|nr:DNA polymerase III subunit gamma/tau [Acidobacteriota bacterium]
PKPCNECPSCKEITRSFSLDMMEIDGATHTSADEARLLADIAKYTPARDRFRIFLIDEVHMLSKAAFNALLKTLEEPPPQAIFLFATTEPHKIPETIDSRSYHFRLKRITEEMIYSYLKEVSQKESILIEDEALRLVARYGEGSMRDSLTILDRLVSYAGLERITENMASAVLGIVNRDFLIKSAKSILFNDLKSLYSLLNELFERGDDPERFLADLMSLMREILRGKATGEISEELSPIVLKVSMENLLRALDVMVSSAQRLKQSLDQRVVLELELTKIASLPNIVPIDKIVKLAEESQLIAADSLFKGDEDNVEEKSALKESVNKEVEKAVTEELSFSALIPFKRIDEEEAKSYDSRNPKIERFKVAVSEELPLVGNAFEKSQLSIDPDGNMHIFMKSSSATVMKYLKESQNYKKLQEIALTQGITGKILIEKGEDECGLEDNREKEAPVKQEYKPKPATLNLISAFEGDIVKIVEKTYSSESGGEDGEFE